MFFGKILNQKNPFVYSKQNVDETIGDVICISNAALAPISKEKAILVLKKDKAQYKIAQLTQQQPNATLNIFIEIDENIELLVKGNGVIHVVGFFEAQHKIDHLDQIELHHLHEHQAQKKQAQLHKQKQIQNKQKEEINKGEQNKIKESPQQQQAAGQDESLDSQQKELNSLSDISQDGSSLKGLDDIDDDIGEQNKQRKKKPQLNRQNKEHQNKNQMGGNKKEKLLVQNNDKTSIQNKKKDKKKKKKEQKKRQQQEKSFHNEKKNSSF